jgi:hypothetical protein
MKERQILVGIRGMAFVLSFGVLSIVPDWTDLPNLSSDIPILIIPIERIIEWREPPPPPPPPPPRHHRAKAGKPAPSISVKPAEAQPAPANIEVAGTPAEPAEFGLLDRALDQPVTWEPRMEPEAAPLPEIVTRKAEEGERHLPMALPGQLPSRGEVYQGRGGRDLPDASKPSYTGPSTDAPTAAMPQVGISHNVEAPDHSLPELAKGETYQSPAGLSDSKKTSDDLSIGDDIVDEAVLSGLLRWLQGQGGASFAPVVMNYMETKPEYLKGRARFQGWDIHVQFSEIEHQLKLFLVKGETAILLADSDFRSRSQFLGLGRVTQSPSGLSAIVAVRDRPTTERTRDFYAVFYAWMQSEGITFGANASR